MVGSIYAGSEVTVKDGVNREILLEEPKEVITEPMPRPETPGEHETAQAVTDRKLKDKLRRDRVILENDERRERGPKVGHNVFYNENLKRHTSRFFLALGTEGKKKFVQKNPHIEISKLDFTEMVRLAKVSFEKTKNITYEFISRMKNTVLQDTMTFENFTPDEVLKRAIKFEQSKQTTQRFRSR